MHKCPKNHTLGFAPKANRNISCNRCKSDMDDEHWSCRLCDYDVCDSCRINMENEGTQRPNNDDDDDDSMQKARLLMMLLGLGKK